jgi:two-component system sensor histidine kinase PilS (NtrC family)
VLRDSSGNPTGQVVIFQDVSDVVEMEKELKRSERLAAVGELSASIAHEIRNPLAAISGAIQVMAGGPEGNIDDAKKLTQIVEREVERLNLLITDFLQFARPGTARPEEVRVQGVVDEVLEMYEAMRPENIQIEEEIETGTDAYADPAQLRQILWNLLLNASQAMPEGGVLKIAAHSVSPASQGLDSTGRLETVEKPIWTEISVFDQGVGMPADIVDRAFDPFFTTKPGGSGLGLATVHRIIQDHGGSVRIERAGDGWETVVRVRIPRAEAA